MLNPVVRVRARDVPGGIDQRHGLALVEQRCSRVEQRALLAHATELPQAETEEQRDAERGQRDCEP